MIGFWFARKYDDPKKITPKEAGLKAFLTTRIGDTIMLAGIFLLYAQTQSLSFADIFKPEMLEHLATTTVNLPLIGAMPWATLIAILIFFGAIGKSAQFPLHVWLPDAMEGPTPVSALIHAATMVSAGVYLVIRTFPLMQAVDRRPALHFIAFIGAFTALFAATIALAQNDIKKVLAYSTISQLGYMFAALGIGAYVAATFHLLTHAFFKALLFLGSGSVIHGMEHGHHETEHGAWGAETETGEHGHHRLPITSLPSYRPFDPQDMRNMGGLFRRMPRTAWTFIIGGLALSGFPIITAGFWSKDEILADAWHQRAPARLRRPGAGRAADRVLYRSADRDDLLRQAAHRRRRARQRARQHLPVDDDPADGAGGLCRGGRLGGHPDHLPRPGRTSPPIRSITTSGAWPRRCTSRPPSCRSMPVPLLTSLVVALGGLFLGWLVYREVRLAGAQQGDYVAVPDAVHRSAGKAAGPAL